MLNQLKQAAEQKVVEAQQENVVRPEASEDATRPSGGVPMGTHHPLPVVRREIVGIFQNMSPVEGPEIEDDWHVFSGLNFPPEHPAHDMQDTFFVERDPDMVLRTHMSSGAGARTKTTAHAIDRLVACSGTRPFRPGALHVPSWVVHRQGCRLPIETDLVVFREVLFGPETDIRLRPSYFLFTEPSAEDVYWGSNRSGKRITKGTGWLEILGCGMVDPNVLKASGIDPEVYSGFAFGMGIERITMLRYQIGDLRHFFENDRRFLDQFVGER